MASKISLMLNDQGLREENIVNSRKQIRSLNWESKVDEFVRSYQKAADLFAKKRNDFFKQHVNNFEFFINDFYMTTIDNFQQQITEYQRCIQEEKQFNQKLKDRIDQMQNTLSWRITAPLRESNFLQGLFQKDK